MRTRRLLTAVGDIAVYQRAAQSQDVYKVLARGDWCSRRRSNVVGGGLQAASRALAPHDNR